MKVNIYGVGGPNNEKLMGTAHDPETGLSLIYLLEKEDASGCSLHGCMRDGEPALSGELSLLDARRLFENALGTRVWVVSLHTGEYEDKQALMLKAFTNPDKAEEFKNVVNAELRARGLDVQSSTRSRAESRFRGIVVDYTGATVSVSPPIPLLT